MIRLQNWIADWLFGTASSAAILELDDVSGQYLSFMNLVEAHVLCGISRYHGVRIPKVRSALTYVRSALSIARPLIAQEFKTDGKSLFIERLGQTVNASQHGQVTLDALLSARLERIDRDTAGLPTQLHPYTRSSAAGRGSEQPKVVTINPLFSFGRPSVRGVSTSVIWGRYAAGDDMLQLSTDYGLNITEIEEAIRCEAIAQAA